MSSAQSSGWEFVKVEVWGWGDDAAGSEAAIDDPSGSDASAYSCGCYRWYHHADRIADSHDILMRSY